MIEMYDITFCRQMAATDDADASMFHRIYDEQYEVNALVTVNEQ